MSKIRPLVTKEDDKRLTKFSNQLKMRRLETPNEERIRQRDAGKLITPHKGKPWWEPISKEVRRRK